VGKPYVIVCILRSLNSASRVWRLKIEHSSPLLLRTARLDTLSLVSKMQPFAPHDSQVNAKQSSATQNFRPLQPVSADHIAASQYQQNLTTALKSKRRPALGACVACRERKTKCDGNRPVCKSCVQKDTDCSYELGIGETLSDARKRKSQHSQRELLDYRHLFNLLRSCPEPEALTLLHQLRASPSDASMVDCLSTVVQEFAPKALLAGPICIPQPSDAPQNVALTKSHLPEGASCDATSLFRPSSTSLAQECTAGQQGLEQDCNIPIR
jgi:hypothetical protein